MSKDDELLTLLWHGLPPPVRRHWYNVKQLEAILTKVDFHFVSNAIKYRQNDITSNIGQNKHSISVQYCFDDVNKKYPVPKWQLKTIKDALKADVSNNEKGELLPTIPDDYSSAFQFRHLKEYVKSTKTAEPSLPPQQGTQHYHLLI